MIARLTLAALLAALTLGACGVKGDPVRPGSEPEIPAETSTETPTEPTSD